MRKAYADATIASPVAVSPLAIAPLALIPGGMGWACQGLDALASMWPAGWLALGLAGSACVIAGGLACVDRVDRR